MPILTKTNDFLQSLGKHIGAQRKKQFAFAFKSISPRPLISLNANTRQTVKNRKTAESKIYRTLHNHRLLTELSQLIVSLGFVQEGDYVNVDFSDFGKRRQVLMFSKQTKQGRALPIYFEVL